MPMVMMKVREMGMAVAHGLVTVPMRMRLRHRSIVLMPMVGVVDVTVLMLERFMGMLMFVPLCQMEVEA